MKRLFSCLAVSLSLLIIFCMTPVSALGIEEVQNKAELVISDPTTGQTWRWNLSDTEPSTNFVYKMSSEANAIDGEVVTELTAEVNITDYLIETLRANPEAIEVIKYDDIIMKTGFTYTANVATNMVSVYTVYGSTTPSKDYYYASNRRVAWRNPYAAANPGGTFNPTTNSWSYSVNSGPGQYLSSTPPFSSLECRINITGMTGYREVFIVCKL